jgi:hypothetical protein
MWDARSDPKTGDAKMDAKTYTNLPFDEIQKKRAENETFIAVYAWSGNVRPWAASVYIGGVYSGKSGYCATPTKASNAALKILEKKQAK